MIEYENLNNLNKPYLKDFNEKIKNLFSNGVFILGNNVSEFELNFAKINNAKFCVGVASGLDALILSLRLKKFKKGSSVLVPSNTYIATIIAILNAGLKPVLVEPCPTTYNVTHDQIKNKWDSNCVAIIVVHLYGRLVEMQDIKDFAKEKNLLLIEDCAQSHFAEKNKIYSGTFGDLGCFSFYPTKNLGAIGDAGAILTNDEGFYNDLKTLRNYGSDKKYSFTKVGLNSRLDEIQAIFLNLKLKDAFKYRKRKIELASIYHEELANIEKLILPQKSMGYSHVWHIFNILISNGKRKYVRSRLLEEGVVTDIHYPIPPSSQSGYEQIFNDQKYPISDLIHKSTISLPISVIHSRQDIKFVCDKLIKIVKEI